MRLFLKPNQSYSVTRRFYSKYLSTPIFYVNANPHVGHLYTAVLGDAWTRFQRLKSPNENQVLFSTGTDEHGLKVQQAAERLNVDVPRFCDAVSERFRILFRRFDVEFTDFVRTSEGRHLAAVGEFWGRLEKSGLISKGVYEGWYDSVDECFVSEGDSQVSSKPGVERVTKETNHPLTYSSEENYVFDLPAMRQDLVKWLDGDVVHPKSFKKNLQQFFAHDFHQLSISRPKTRLYWGVPVPSDPTQTIYVWLDALVNYLTVAGFPGELKVWPGVHLIGKDILKFHGVYWPAFLMAAGMKPPEELVVHSHWLVDDTKMSKSLGNTVNPMDSVDVYSSDGWRYFLLREGVLDHDGNFNASKMASILNAELADTLGNLVLRCTSANLNPNHEFPSPVELSSITPQELINQAKNLPSIVEKHFEDFYFYKGLEEIQSLLRSTNAFVQSSEPWVMKKRGDLEALKEVIYVSLEICRSCAILMQPIVPNYSKTILDILGIPENERSWPEAVSFVESSPSRILLREKPKLFNKIRLK